MWRPLKSTLFPYTTLFRSGPAAGVIHLVGDFAGEVFERKPARCQDDETIAVQHTPELQPRENDLFRVALEKQNVELVRRALAATERERTRSSRHRGPGRPL